MITDPIANALNQIKMSAKVKKKSVTFYSSNTINSILQVMKEEGYIVDYVVKKSETNIKKTTVFLKYKQGVSAIFGIKRVSRPSYKVMKGVKDIPIVMNGLGTAIMSTNKGIMCEKKARQLNVGGEIFAYIW